MREVILLFVVLTGCITATLAYSNNEKTFGVKKRQLKHAPAEEETGDICDPTRAKPCEVETEVCAWDSKDMMYKCTHPTTKRSVSAYARYRKHKKKDEEEHKVEMKHQGKIDSEHNYKRQTSVATNANFQIQNEGAPTSAPNKRSLLSQEQKTSESNAKSKFEMPNLNPENNVDDDITSKIITRSVHNSTEDEVENNSENSDLSVRVPAGRQVDTKPKKLGGGTSAVPEYSGKLTWDGNEDNAQPCITKKDMADHLQAIKKWDDKKDWAMDHADEICDFTKFFHCMGIEEDTQGNGYDYYEEDEEEPLARNTIEEVEEAGNHVGEKSQEEARLKEEGKGNEEIEETVAEERTAHGEGPKGRQVPAEGGSGKCRCYDASMTVVNSKCYIPADKGAKSDCENITAPYPIRPWKRAPPLRPRCTPNSDCRESQYWFGKRCSCRWYAKLNPETNECDSGVRFSVARFLIWSLIVITCVL